MTILQYPVDNGNVYRWARTYIKFYLARGPNYAAKYILENVPKQFYKQLATLCQRELLRRGIIN